MNIELIFDAMGPDSLGRLRQKGTFSGHHPGGSLFGPSRCLWGSTGPLWSLLYPPDKGE